MAKQSMAVLVAMVVLCVSMAAAQVSGQSWPAPAPYMRGWEPSSAPMYAPAWSPSAYAPDAAPEGSPVSAPVVESPAYAPSSGPSVVEGPSWAYAPVPSSGR